MTTGQELCDLIQGHIDRLTKQNERLPPRSKTRQSRMTQIGMLRMELQQAQQQLAVKSPRKFRRK